MTFSIANNKTTTTGSIIDRVITFEDACDVLGLSGVIADFKLNDNIDETSKSIQAFIKLQIIAKALNEGWVPDWSKGNQYKHYPYFDLEEGFSLNRVFYRYRFSHVGSRLCFKSEALAKYAATQFIDLYKDFMLFS